MTLNCKETKDDITKREKQTPGPTKRTPSLKGNRTQAIPGGAEVHAVTTEYSDYYLKKKKHREKKLQVQRLNAIRRDEIDKVLISVI